MNEKGNKRDKIVRTLSEEIASGRYSPLGPFPSERSLVVRFGVARETIRAVLDKLTEQGLIYRRPGSRALVKSRTDDAKKRIGTLLTGTRYSEIFRQMAGEIVRLAAERQLATVSAEAASLDYSAVGQEAVALARRLVAEKVSGVIFQPVEFAPDRVSSNAEILRIFAEASVPVVLLDTDAVHYPNWSGLDLVGIDNLAAGRMLAEHLQAKGVRRVAFLNRKDCADSVNLRHAGALCVFGNDRIERLQVSSCSDLKEVREALSLVRSLEAVICQNDVAAVMVHRALGQLGLSVPKDVMLAGFDDVSLASAMHPSLTTVRQPCAAMARTALDRLLARMESPDLPPVDFQLHAELVVRGSTDLYRIHLP